MIEIKRMVKRMEEEEKGKWWRDGRRDTVKEPYVFV